jgi:hypothetical protein
MNNFEIIEVVKKIVGPYFQFNVEDFYGDRGSCEYPKIEEMNTLFFKLNGKDKKLTITKNEQKKMVDEITNLNIGLVELISVNALGKYIIITLYKNIDVVL